MSLAKEDIELKKTFSNSIIEFKNLGIRILGIDAPIGEKYRDMLGGIDTKVLDLNESINEINIDLFKLTSKTEGLYLKDLARIDASFIDLKYSDTIGQVNLINEHDEYKERKVNSINEKCNNIRSKAADIVEAINKLNRGIKELIRLEEILRKELPNDRLINETIIHLANNLDLF